MRLTWIGPPATHFALNQGLIEHYTKGKVLLGGKVKCCFEVGHLQSVVSHFTKYMVGHLKFRNKKLISLRQLVVRSSR